MPTVAERFVRDGRQSLKSMFAKKHIGQMALELSSSGKRSLRFAREFEQSMEQLAILHDAGQKRRLRSAALFVGNSGAYVADQSGQIYASRANIRAGLAANAILTEHLRLVFAMIEIG